MVQALKTMPNVKKLNLRGNTCRNEGVEALADYLKVHPPPRPRGRPVGALERLCARGWNSRVALL
eukprot:3079865-Prymnesium_polylepis.1